VLVGCGAETIDEHPCPPGNTLTYENFGKQYFQAQCVRCHGGPNGYSSRSFTTVEAIRSDRERIYANAAGPNVTMPPGPDDPPESERKKLADWLACGAP
jgi:mono/diheme cytochrome c family protein